jgi:hypothetical protein
VPLFDTWADTVSWLIAKHGAAATASVFPTAVTQLVSAITER